MRRSRAIVGGGSLGGMLAAQVLSKYFDEVLVLDRETRTGDEMARFVPQMNHNHFMHHSCSQNIESVFPGWTDIIRKRAFALRPQRMAWRFYGNWLNAAPRMKSDLTAYAASRPVWDNACRTLLEKNPKVEFREGVTITGFLTSEDKSRICGVSIEGGETIDADFVVDATGASSKSMDWLEKLGYQRPSISFIKPRLTYTSRLFERKPNQAPFTHNWDAVLSWPPSVESKRGALLTPIEDNRWHCSLGAECGDPCPKTDEGYLEFAKSLGIPHVYDILKDAVPVTPITQMSIPKTWVWHLEKAKQVPDGYIMFGDARARLNPVFAQGMTIASKNALTLDECLGKYFKDKQSKIPKQYYKRTFKYIFNSWLLTTSEDFRHPELKDTVTTGFPRPVLNGVGWYTKRVLKQMASSPSLLEAFFNVAGINAEPPTFLFHPAAVSKVFLAGLGIEKALQDPYSMTPAGSE